MLRTFIACRVTGEDPDTLRTILQDICQALGEVEVDVYCTFLDPNEAVSKNGNARAVMDHAFRVIDGVDFLLVLQTNEEKSEGMLMEVGYCIRGMIPIVVATKSGLTGTYLPQMAQHVIRWDSVEDLLAQIRGTDFKNAVEST